MEEQEDVMHRKIAIDQFLRCKGFQIFKERLEDLLTMINNDVRVMEEKAINLDRIGTFNHKCGFKDGITQVKYVLDEMKEELEEDAEIAVGR